MHSFSQRQTADKVTLFLQAKTDFPVQYNKTTSQVTVIRIYCLTVLSYLQQFQNYNYSISLTTIVNIDFSFRNRAYMARTKAFPEDHRQASNQGGVGRWNFEILGRKSGCR